MATFPRTEGEILILAQNLIAGLTANAATYPAPPVAPPALQAVLASFNTLQNNAAAAQAAAAQATALKMDGLEELTDAMKSDLRYAENTVNYDDAQLKMLGWGGRKTAATLLPPGQCRVLEAPRQGEGWLFLDWKEPVDGGAVAAYKVLRRERPAGLWTNVATAVESEVTLVDQPRAKEWEYRVIAVNKSGEGEPSNTVLAVL